jgi:hypothetical protein
MLALFDTSSQASPSPELMRGKTVTRLVTPLKYGLFSGSTYVKSIICKLLFFDYIYNFCCLLACTSIIRTETYTPHDAVRDSPNLS